MNTAEPTTALTNAPSRKLFKPMFRARWQNMQNIINNSSFYDMVPEPYKTYYYAYVRQWLQWSTGFVPMLHRQDFFSTGMGYTVCDIYTKECMSGGYRFDSANEELQRRIEEWAENDFEDALNKMFFYANAGGNAMLCLTPIGGEFYASVYPIDRVLFRIGRRGDVTQAVIFNRFTAGEAAYYAREYRIMMDGVPYRRVELTKGTLVTVPEFTGMALPCVPDRIKTAWECAFGEIEPNVWYRMPPGFRSLGLYNVRNKSVAVAIQDLPGYSDSTLHTALDVLYSIDYNYTQSQVDQYMGKSVALIPPQMQLVTVETGQRTLVVEGKSYRDSIQSAPAPLDDQFFTQVRSQGPSGEPIKPLFIQPDLRGEAHKYIRDSDLELLASKVGLSSTTLANHLTYNSPKTATEVRSEKDTTEVSVNNKRKLANRAINAMLNDLAAYYGYADRVEITWGRAGANTSTENSELLADYQAGTLSLKDYLLKRWSDLSDADATQKAQELEEEASRKQASLFDEQNYFGDPDNGNDDRGQTAE